MNGTSTKGRPRLTTMLRELEDALYAGRHPLSDKLNQMEPILRGYLKESVRRPFTPHDFDHSVDVEQYAAELVTLLPAASPLRNQPSSLFYLTLAVWIHDAGMVPFAENEALDHVRATHHLRVEPVLKRLFTEILDPMDISLVSSVAKNHCEESPSLLPVMKTYQREHEVLGNTRVTEYPRLYAAILRLADIVAITNTRTPWFLFRDFEMNPISEKHWRAHLMINSVYVSTEGGEPRICIDFDYSSLSLRRFIEEHVRRIEQEIALCHETLETAGLQLFPRVLINATEKSISSQKGFDVLPAGLYRLLVSGLYDRPDVFMRELIQNGLDATTRQIAEAGVCLPERIDVTVEYEGQRSPRCIRTIKFRDFGFGMDQSDIDAYLLQITAKSIDDPETLAKLKSAKLELIAEWGIGFLSVFGVSENVTVRSHKLEMRPIRVEFKPRSAPNGQPESLTAIAALATEDREPLSEVDRGTEICVVLANGLDFDPLERLESILVHPTIPINYIERGAQPRYQTLAPAVPTPPPASASQRRPAVLVTGAGIRGGWISFDPEGLGGGIQITQAGILVEDNVLDLVDIHGISGVIDCTTRFLPLAAARNKAIRDSTQWLDLKQLVLSAVPKAVGIYLLEKKAVVNVFLGKSLERAIDQLLQLPSVRESFLTEVELACVFSLHGGERVAVKAFPEWLRRKGDARVYLFSKGLDAESGLYGHEHSSVEHVVIWIPHQSVVTPVEKKLLDQNKCLMQITPFFQSSGAHGQYHNCELLTLLLARHGIEIDETLLDLGRGQALKDVVARDHPLFTATGIREWTTFPSDIRALCAGYWSGKFHFVLNQKRPVVQKLLEVWRDRPEDRALVGLLLKCYAESLRIEPEKVVRAIEDFEWDSLDSN
jgi:hypothetical protein